MISPVPNIIRVKTSKRRAINAILRTAYRKFANDKTSREAVKLVLTA